MLLRLKTKTKSVSGIAAAWGRSVLQKLLLILFSRESLQQGVKGGADVLQLKILWLQKNVARFLQRDRPYSVYWLAFQTSSFFLWVSLRYSESHQISTAAKKQERTKGKKEGVFTVAVYVNTQGESGPSRRKPSLRSRLSSAGTACPPSPGFFGICCWWTK